MEQQFNIGNVIEHYKLNTEDLSLIHILKNTNSGSWQKVSSGFSTEESVLSLRNYIFVGGNTKADRWVNAGLFDFIFDAYFDIDLEAGFWYHLTSINRQNKSFILYRCV